MRTSHEHVSPFSPRTTRVLLAALLMAAGSAAAQPVSSAVPPAPVLNCGQFIAPIAPLPGFALSVPTAVSENGVWVTGTGLNSTLGTSTTFIYSPMLGVFDLGAGAPSTQGSDVSDGAVVVAVPSLGWLPGLPGLVSIANLVPGVVGFGPETITHDAQTFAGVGDLGAGIEPITVDRFGVRALSPLFPSPSFALVRKSTETIHHRSAAGRLDAHLAWLLPAGGIDGIALIYDQSAPTGPTIIAPTLIGNVPTAMSGDASVIAGTGFDLATNTQRTFLFRHGFETTIPGVTPSAQITGLSSDGRIAVGVDNNVGIYIDTRIGLAPQNLLTVLSTVYGLNTAGWTALAPSDMSASGVIVGTGVFMGQNTGFAARICPPPYCYADFNKNGVVGDPGDFAEFNLAIAAGLMIADCDLDGALTIADTVCYTAVVAIGC